MALIQMENGEGNIFFSTRSFRGKIAKDPQSGERTKEDASGRISEWTGSNVNRCITFSCLENRYNRFLL